MNSIYSFSVTRVQTPKHHNALIINSLRASKLNLLRLPPPHIIPLLLYLRPHHRRLHALHGSIDLMKDLERHEVGIRASRVLRPRSLACLACPHEGASDALNVVLLGLGGVDARECDEGVFFPLEGERCRCRRWRR